jgi:hypothetical protein
MDTIRSSSCSAGIAPGTSATSPRLMVTSSPPREGGMENDKLADLEVMKRRLFNLVAVALLAIPGWAADEVKRLHALFDRTWETRLKESPTFATSVGRHARDRMSRGDGNQDGALRAALASVRRTPFRRTPFRYGSARIPRPDSILDHGRSGDEATRFPTLL